MYMYVPTIKETSPAQLAELIDDVEGVDIADCYYGSTCRQYDTGR